MVETIEFYLEKFYSKLTDILKREKKEGSVFFSFLLTKYSNKLQSILRQATIDGNNIPKELLNDLVEKKLVIETDVLGQFIISSRGIWEYETLKQIITIDQLLDFITNRVYTFDYSSKKLLDREKVVVFALIAIRAFSDKTAVDLNKGETSLNAWKDILKKSHEKLGELKGVSESYSFDDFYRKKGKDGKKVKVNLDLEDPIIHTFRHIDQLPKKTRDIVKNLGNRKYYLNLAENNIIIEDKFKFLIQRIFEDAPLTFTDYQKISNFFNEISLHYSTVIFDSGENLFSSPEHSEKMKDILLFGSI